MSVLVATVVVVMMCVCWWLWRRQSEEWAECGSEGSEWAAPGGWVRPLITLEHLCWVGGLLGSMNTAQVLYLHSEQPVSTKVVRRAFLVLAQRCLVLQLCVKSRWWWPWYRRMGEVKVELTESTDEPLSVYERDLARGYNLSEGPLWRVTLVRRPHTKEEVVVVFTIHHAVTDGTSNMVLSRDLMTIINSLMTDQDDHTPIRGLVPPISTSLVSPYDILPVLSFMASVLRKGKPFVTRGAAQFLQPPTPAPPITAALCHDFTTDVTTQLSRRCKEAGVRIHSCLLAACSLAYLRTARKNGERVASMPIVHETAVSIRRYYPASQQEALGTVSFPIHLEHPVDETQDLWVLSKTIQEDLYRVLNQEKVPLRVGQNGLSAGAVFPANRMLSKMGMHAFTYANFTCTNMGDLRTLLPTSYSGPVSVTRLLRSTQAEMAGTCFCVVTQTLGGRLMVSVEHYTTKTSRTSIHTFLTHLAHILTHLALTGTTPYTTPHQDTLTTTDAIPIITTTTHHNDTPNKQTSTTNTDITANTDADAHNIRQCNSSPLVTTPTENTTTATTTPHENCTTSNKPTFSHSKSNGTVPTHTNDTTLSHSKSNGTIPAHTNDTTLSHSKSNDTIPAHTNDTNTANHDPTLSHSLSNGTVPACHHSHQASVTPECQ